MQKGFLARSARPAGYTEPCSESPHIAELRKKLTSAEYDLRCRRQERLAATPAKPIVNNALPTLRESAVKALISHTDPPPESLHRLAAAVVLLLEAEVLISMGDHVPDKLTPWSNIQLLLKREEIFSEPTEKLVECLKGSTNGMKLVAHVHEQILGRCGGSIAITKEIVGAADKRCEGIFDFVSAVLDAVFGDGEKDRAVDAPTVAGEEPLLGEADMALVEAVAEQERVVARLRKQLKEEERSERAAYNFAVNNSPTAAFSSGRVVETRREAARIARELQEVERAELAAERSKAESAEAEISASPLIEEAGFERTSADGEIRVLAQTFTLQYRLGESAVPGELQATILASAERFLREPRLRAGRSVDVICVSELREDPEVAHDRADGIRAWFAAHGLQSSVLNVETRASNQRGDRYVQLRLFDSSGRNEDARLKMERLIGEMSLQKQAEEIDTSGTAAIGMDKKVGAGKFPGASPTETVAETSTNPVRLVLQEVAADETGRRGLRVVFAEQGLLRDDTIVEIGGASIRFSSNSHAWNDKEVQLPFVVDEASSIAKFSKRESSLTVTLRSVV